MNTPRPQPHTRFKQSKTIREITISENKHSNNRDTDKFNTLFVQLQVSNVCTDAVLDTAAQVSVMSYKFYQKLRSPPALSDHVMLKGIDKSNLDSRICNNVPIEFGQFKCKWNFVVADISDSILLGLDFLEHHQAILNLQDFSVSIEQMKMPIKCLYNKNHEKVNIFRVQMKKKMVIPPKSCIYVDVKFDKTPDFDVVINPYHNIQGLLSPNCVTKKDQNVILFKNPTDKYITVRKNADVGTAMQLDQIINIGEHVQSEDDTETPEIRSVGIDCTNLDRIKKQIPEFLISMYEKSIQNLTEEQSITFGKFLINYQEVFSKDDFDMGLFNGDIEHKINTGNATPIRQKLRRTPKCFEEEEKKHLDQMLEKGIIEPSSSDWASSPVLVRKKDGSLRYCIDFRALNKVTVRDAFPLPNMSDCIESLKGSTFLSTLDMQAAYWNIKVHKDDKHKTAFITKYGLFEHNRLPFGLCNSPATFSRVIQLVLQGLTWLECLAYLDDILVLGSDFQDHITKLGNVLSRFKKFNLKLKPKKCQFFQKEVKFLGKIVNGNGIMITPENVTTMKNWPTPTNVKEVESFLGFANYHRDHVEHFAEIVEPLHQLTNKKQISVGYQFIKRHLKN